MFYIVLILKVKYFVTVLTVNIMNIIDGQFLRLFVSFIPEKTKVKTISFKYAFYNFHNTGKLNAHDSF
jgi:hypothetical protein